MGQSSGLWAHCQPLKLHCRFHLMSVKSWTVDVGQWTHCRGHSPQRAWPRFRARRVTAIAFPPIPEIKIAAGGALPIIAWAMAPVAAVTPMPVTVPALMAPPIPCPQSLWHCAIAKIDISANDDGYVYDLTRATSKLLAMIAANLGPIVPYIRPQFWNRIPLQL